MYSKGLNFACPVHTYAFQEFLTSHGIDCTVLDYRPNYFDDFDLRHSASSMRKEYLRLKKKAKKNPSLDKRVEAARRRWISHLLVTPQREIRYDRFKKFIDTHYRKTDFTYDTDTLEYLDPGFDCYICVTDVIWRNVPHYGFDRGYFLGSTAMENKWKIAYSPGRGTDFSKNENDTNEFFHYVNDIDFLSVRERSTQDYIEKHSGRRPELVLDPVLLMDRSFYENLSITPLEEHYVLLYHVVQGAEDSAANAADYAKRHNLKIIQLTDVTNSKLLEPYTDVQHENRYAIGVEDWLGYILHADAIFTNSFHAICFSILFEKKLYVGVRKSDKVENILHTFHLEDRRIHSIEDLREKENRDIDFTEVRKILEKEREKSTDFILSALNYCETHERPGRDYTTWKKNLKFKIAYVTDEPDQEHAYDDIPGKMRRVKHACYFRPEKKSFNDGTDTFLENRYDGHGKKFAGWALRFKIENRQILYLKNGNFILEEEYDENVHGSLKLFKPGEKIPYLPVNQLKTVHAIAMWKEPSKNRLKQLFRRER